MSTKGLACLILLFPILLYAQDIEEEEEMVFVSQQNVTIVSEAINEIVPRDEQFLKTVFGTSTAISRDTAGNLLLTPGIYTLPYATSSLPADAYGSYGPGNLDDYNISTAWSEGVQGPGIGQWIAVASGDSFTAVVVNNGYCKDQRGWENNNRVRQARIGIYTFTQPESSRVRVGKNKVEYIVVFEDKNEDAFWQVWDGITGISGKEPGSYLFVLEILDVYCGRKYDDTCISNVSLTVMQ
jgi:hypothetical protein